MNERLGNYIKNGREQKNISQRELARKVGVDNTAISRIEKGLVYKPKFVLLFRICFFLELDLLKLSALANYSMEELKALGSFTGIKGTIKYAGSDKEDKYYIIDENENKRLSIVEVLKGYKKNELSLQECLGLISAITDTDIRAYISEKEIRDNELQDILGIDY